MFPQPRVHDMNEKPAKDSLVPALGFHWLTPYYDFVVRLTTREETFKSALIEQAAIRPNDRVLDLGCGTGTLSVWIKQRHPDAIVTAVDGDPEVLGMAGRKAATNRVEIKFDRAYSNALPHRDRSFEKVMSTLFFHHLTLEDKTRTLAEAYRVLSPGGQLHVADWGKARGPLMRSLFFAIQILDGYKNTQDNVSGKLFEAFSAAGFVNVTERRTFSTMFGTMSLYSAVKPFQGP
jgi:2-polyprenyl-3-methyl-5-hydroxy-6-metoxy-1,4-benzoquinol methylase